MLLSFWAMGSRRRTGFRLFGSFPAVPRGPRPVPLTHSSGRGASVTFGHGSSSGAGIDHTTANCDMQAEIRNDLRKCCMQNNPIQPAPRHDGVPVRKTERTYISKKHQNVIAWISTCSMLLGVQDVWQLHCSRWRMIGFIIVCESVIFCILLLVAACQQFLSAIHKDGASSRTVFIGAGVQAAEAASVSARNLCC